MDTVTIKSFVSSLSSARSGNATAGVSVCSQRTYAYDAHVSLCALCRPWDSSCGARDLAKRRRHYYRTRCDHHGRCTVARQRAGACCSPLAVHPVGRGQGANHHAAEHVLGDGTPFRLSSLGGTSGRRRDLRGNGTVWQPECDVQQQDHVLPVDQSKPSRLLRSCDLPLGYVRCLSRKRRLASAEFVPELSGNR